MATEDQSLSSADESWSKHECDTIYIFYKCFIACKQESHIRSANMIEERQSLSSFIITQNSKGSQYLPHDTHQLLIRFNYCCVSYINLRSKLFEEASPTPFRMTP